MQVGGPDRSPDLKAIAAAKKKQQRAAAKKTADKQARNRAAWNETATSLAESSQAAVHRAQQEKVAEEARRAAVIEAEHQEKVAEEARRSAVIEAEQQEAAEKEQAGNKKKRERCTAFQDLAYKYACGASPITANSRCPRLLKIYPEARVWCIRSRIVVKLQVA
jgi:hypothetical protein